MGSLILSNTALATCNAK